MTKYTRGVWLLTQGSYGWASQAPFPRQHDSQSFNDINAAAAVVRRVVGNCMLDAGGGRS